MNKLEHFKLMLLTGTYGNAITWKCPSLFKLDDVHHELGCNAHWKNPYNENQTLEQKVVEMLLADDDLIIANFCPQEVELADYAQHELCSPVKTKDDDREKCRECWTEKVIK